MININLKDKHILTIDDSDTIRKYLKNVLSPLGALLEGAATGEEGLEKCVAQNYNIILLDLILPDIDGIEVLKQIRERNDNSTIVMLTGHGGIKSAIAAVRMGADGYLQKQDITTTCNNHQEFLYALEQAIEHRAGLAAQKQLEDVRADFYAMVTHDLRNPTSVILAANEILLKGRAGELMPLQKELISTSFKAAKKLLSLINDYLDFTKIDAGYLHLSLKDIELRDVIKTNVQLARIQAQVKQQTITLELPHDPVTAYADPERLKQVFDNLLSNAVKYTPEGGYITVKLLVKDDQAIFHVSDTGEGIPTDQLSVLFTKYHRVPGATKRGIHGTGLGLLIVKEIVEAHGGTVYAESEGVPDKGTTFTVTIKLRQEEKSSQNTESPPQDMYPAKHEIKAEEPNCLLTSKTPQFENKKTESVSSYLSEDPELIKLFFEESQGHILTLQDVIGNLHHTPQDPKLIRIAYITSHTLKGNSGAMQQTTIHALSAQIEYMLIQALKGEVTLTKNQVSDLEKLLDSIKEEIKRSRDSKIHTTTI